MKHFLRGTFLAFLIASGVRAEEASVQFTVDLTRDVKPISRYIYGVNQQLGGNFANIPLTRSGGNRLTAYNWVNNASNAGSDWQFQNDGIMGGGEKPGGGVSPAIENASQNHAAIILTIPICDYVAADKKGGGDVHQSGANYLQTRFRENAARKGSRFTLTPDPSSPRVFQDEFVNWVKTTYPYSVTDSQRPIFFSMDNEPDLWPSTHKEIHPKPTTYAEVVQRNIDFATAVKSVAPQTKIFGPVNYGWQGFVNLQNAPDAGGRDFQEFYLAQMKAAEKAAGKRLLDVFDVHWYPEAQGGGKRISGQESDDEVVAARLQAPRSLWDPTYTEKSWITQWSTNGPINLIPRLFKKIQTQYPGTLLSMTEYNYGGGAHISGGIAEADVLGIFGVQGLFSAAQWPLSGKEQFIAGGLKMFRNCDGSNSAFGDTSIFASTSSIADTSIYASIDTKNRSRLVLVAINKTAGPIKAAIKIQHASAYKSAKVYQLTSAGADPKPADPVAVGAGGSLSYVMPAYSVSTMILTAP